VCWKIQSALMAAGLPRVGMLYKPHIACFRERIRVGGLLVDEQPLCEAVDDVERAARLSGAKVGFFDVLTLAALLHFARADCSAVVLEAGIGGRLDATSVCWPALSCVTSVGLDHMDLLGPTTDAIAAEKVAIYREGAIAVAGPSVPRHVASAAAAAAGVASLSFVESVGEGLDFEAENRAVAERCLRLLASRLPEWRIAEGAIAAGLEARPPCRFEELDVVRPAAGAPLQAQPAGPVAVGSSGGARVVLDVAHNVTALDALLRKVRATYPRQWQSGAVSVVLGLSADKQLAECVAQVASALPADRLHLVQAHSARAATVGQLLQHVPASARRLVRVYPGVPGERTGVPLPLSSVGSAVEFAVDETVRLARGGGASPSPTPVVVVCGSFFIMREAREALGVDEVRDPWDV
jgi:dihydrofolate synthase/folylpolyglutamate synthase